MGKSDKRIKEIAKKLNLSQGSLGLPDIHEFRQALSKVGDHGIITMYNIQELGEIILKLEKMYIIRYDGRIKTKRFTKVFAIALHEPFLYFGTPIGVFSIRTGMEYVHKDRTWTFKACGMSLTMKR